MKNRNTNLSRRKYLIENRSFLKKKNETIIKIKMFKFIIMFPAIKLAGKREKRKLII